MTAEITKTNKIHIEDAPAVPGLTFRYYRGGSDIPAIVDVFNAANKADQIEEHNDVEQMTFHYNNLTRCNPDEDIIIAEVEGQMAATGRAWWHEEIEGRFIYMLYGTVHPEWRRRGIGRAIQGWLEARAAQIAAGHDPEKPKFIDTWSADTQPGRDRLMRSFGFEDERYFFDMSSDLSQSFPAAPLPEGLEVRPVEPQHYRPIWDAMDEAFRDHWGYVESTEEDYQKLIKAIEERPTHDPNIWKVAWEGDQVAGMVLNLINEEENQALNRKWAWTDPICVRRPWRRQGLARALIVQSMELLRDKGYDTAALGVDTKNPNGALNLYQSCGYQVRKKWTVFRKPLN